MTTLRLSELDWLTAPTDSPANARFEGIIGPDGIVTIAQLAFWPWDTSGAQVAAAQVRMLDAGGLLDAAALGDMSGEAVALVEVDRAGTLASAVPVARYVVDRLIVEDDGRKTLTLRDAHDDLDKIINDSKFADTVTGLAGQPQPMSFGAVFNAPVLLTGSDGSVGWLADAPQAVALLRDRADPMEDGTWTMDSYQQQVLLNSPPLGPMTADLSSVSVVSGQPTPSTLDKAIREIMRRAGITAWSSSDAGAIDTATGYAGVGFYADRPLTARFVLGSVLASYGAWYWQDATGVLRLTRITDPAAMPVAFTLDAADLAADVVYSTDTAPGLSTRMAWRPNARIMRESDFVTDLVDVPHELRAQLSAPQAGVVTAVSAGTLPAEYRHAVDANPYPSLFWLEADAQSEIDRVIALYQSVRRNWVVRVEHSRDLAPIPGQCCKLTYPRYGLSSGRNLLVRRVERNPITGDTTLTLWG